MALPVLPYIPAMGVKHQLLREIIKSEYADGYHTHGSTEVAWSRADGCGGIASYKGLNHFTLGYNKTIKGAGKLADLLWAFFLDKLDKHNAPFYFYNPTEHTPPDLTGSSAIGRYWVRLKNPNQVLNRDYFKYCLYNYKLEFIEDRSLPLLVGPCVTPSDILTSLGTGFVFCADIQTYPGTDPTTNPLINIPISPPHYAVGDTGLGFNTAKFNPDVTVYGYDTRAVFNYADSSVIAKLAVDRITIAFWMYHWGGTIHAQTILSFGNAGWAEGFGTGYSIFVNGGFWYVGTYAFHVDTDLGVKSLDFNLTAGDANAYPALFKWHLVILRYDGYTISAMVDNVLRASQTDVTEGHMIYDDPIPSSIILGNSSGFVAQACNAWIPCVRIWNRALTDAECGKLFTPLA
jgi:hypothetical protein